MIWLFFDAESFQILRTLSFEDRPRGIAVRCSAQRCFLPLKEIAAQADFDGSGKIDFGDFLLFVAAFGAENPDARFDLNEDGQVNFGDFFVVYQCFWKNSVICDDPRKIKKLWILGAFFVCA